MEKIICDLCSRQIAYKEDLVVTTYIIPFVLKKYHNTCYAKREKTAAGFFLIGSKPVNTPVFRITAVIFTIFFLFIFSNFGLILPGLFGLIFVLFFTVAIAGNFVYPIIKSNQIEKGLKQKMRKSRRK